MSARRREPPCVSPGVPETISRRSLTLEECASAAPDQSTLWRGKMAEGDVPAFWRNHGSRIQVGSSRGIMRCRAGLVTPRCRAYNPTHRQRTRDSGNPYTILSGRCSQRRCWQQPRRAAIMMLSCNCPCCLETTECSVMQPVFGTRATARTTRPNGAHWIVLGLVQPCWSGQTMRRVQKVHRTPTRQTPHCGRTIDR